MPLSDLAQSTELHLLHAPLAQDVAESIESALDGGVVFDHGTTVRDVFQHAVSSAIRDIEAHPRGNLLRRFVVEGPYERAGAFPSHLIGQRLSDDETAKAIRFMFSWMVNSFQGRLAELLAAGPMLRLTERLKADGQIPASAKLFIGDAVTAPRINRAGRAKAADVHVLTVRGNSQSPRVQVHALGEIKSYAISEPRVRRQLGKHLARCRHGLVVQDGLVPAERIDPDRDAPLICWVVPATWKLPRGFCFEETDGRVFLHLAAPSVPHAPDEVLQLSDGAYRVTLRWSHEALAAAAYSLTFWYVERIGELVFAEPGTNPWPEMSAAEAGGNAATQSLYHAILRARTRYESDRAIALYNMYGFGYALGLNFRGQDGRRKMLWAKDLREILRDGVTTEGCRDCLLAPAAKTSLRNSSHRSFFLLDACALIFQQRGTPGHIHQCAGRLGRS